MTILEVDLGHVNTYETNTTSFTSIVKTIGIIQDNQSYLITPVQLMNRPQNNVFNVRKSGNTNEYILILSFTKT